MKSYSLHLEFMTVFILLMAVIGFSTCTSSNEEHLIITEQGSFAVGGSVITNPGTFDAIERTPEGQTFTGIMHMYSIRYLKMPGDYLC